MKKTLFWAFALLLFTSMACNLPFGLGEVADPIERLPDIEADSFTADVDEKALLDPVDLSGAQRQVLAVRGTPNRFMIHFSSGMREETWYYELIGYDITFRNGETYTENLGNPVLGDMLLTSDYAPWVFNSEMGLSELLAITGSEGFAIEALDEVFEEEVSLVTLAGLDAGFRGGKLLFVRTVPVGEGARTLDIPVSQPTAQSQVDAASSLTLAEQAHAGTHTYSTYCIYSDGTSEEGIEPITWTFMEDGVYWDEDGPYPWINENHYGLSDEYGELFIYFKENVITITGEFLTADEQDEEVLVTFTCALTQE